MTVRFFLLSLMLSATAIASAHAAQDAKKTEGAPQSVLTQKKKEATPLDIWIAAENKMIDPLSTPDKESIFVMRGKHSVIRTIGVVERDVGAAVKACGKANPDMKDKMTARFDQWKDAVNPIIDTARKNLKSEIEQQNIVKPEEFKKVLKLNDEAFDYGDKRTVKNPVSSPDACARLLNSMDSTENQMVSLLQETLLPASVIKSRVEKAKKVEAEKKSFGKTAK